LNCKNIATILHFKNIKTNSSPLDLTIKYILLLFVVGILFVAKEDVVLILDIFVEYNLYGSALHKELYN
jgi:hypothetical protein